MFNGAAQELFKALKAKVVGLNAMGAGAGHASNKPSQKGPNVDEQKGKAQTKEAHNRIGRGGFEADFASNAVGALDAQSDGDSDDR